MKLPENAAKIKKSGPGCAVNKGDEVICLCNNIPRRQIEEAIRNGADTLNKIFDRTTAGVGPCGGSCRRKLQPMLEHYLTTGAFPETIKSGKKR